MFVNPLIAQINLLLSRQLSLGEFEEWIVTRLGEHDLGDLEDSLLKADATMMAFGEGEISEEEVFEELAGLVGARKISSSDVEVRAGTGVTDHLWTLEELLGL